MDQTASTESVKVDPLPRKEIRFAVVMYGGVSLAIYIHGVAKELLSLVRATARDKDTGNYKIPDAELKGAEVVYRSLGKTLKAKFVVDILSGTSAGGINAVYLAKALVNDRPMDKLKELWVQEGDIAKLINDGHSLNGLGGLTLQDPPEALLNSQRMYYKLLYALKEMGSAPDGARSPYVQQLDLNITATDIRGLNLPIKIRNNAINELRYRTVFKFKYSADRTRRNDFTKDKDPFLAFAARCTSSIPPAFEAMRLQDIEPVLTSSFFKEDYGDLVKPSAAPWNSFYEEYTAAEDIFRVRSFGDGGYLDNKPFSYATETLLNRHADLPVDRKLLYIEPSPEHPEARVASGERPNMIENLTAALLGLPRQETIRDDLRSILDRNEHIARTNKILTEVNAVFQKIISGGTEGERTKFQEEFDNWTPSRSDWPRQFLDEVINEYGAHYPAYHQLRVEDTLDNLASILACGMGWTDGSPEAKDLRAVLNAWREHYYATTSSEAQLHPGRHSENEILSRLDIRWRQRRTSFVQSLANILLDGLEPDNQQGREQASALFKLSRVADSSDYGKADCAEQYRNSIQDLKEEFNRATAEFEYVIDQLSEPPASSSGIPKANLQAYSVQRDQLMDTLGFGKDRNDLATAGANLRRFAEFFNKNEAQDNSMAVPLLKSIEDLTIALAPHEESKKAKAAASAPDALSESPYVKQALRALAVASVNSFGETARGQDDLPQAYKAEARKGIDPEIHNKVQQCLRYFHDRFEYYDMLMFPLQFGTNFGESDEVEIIRVSPEDATKFVDERATGRKKLAGTKLSNFGAFFREEWRENDMLWGRLDAAEILLTELLAGESSSAAAELQSSLRERLAKTGYPADKEIDPYNVAFEMILQEDLKPRVEGQLYKLADGKQSATASKDSMGVKELSALLTDRGRLLNYFREGYQVDTSFEPESTARLADRFVQTLSRMLNGLSKNSSIEKPVRAVTFFMRIAASIVSFALPKSFANFLFTGYWVWLLYAAEAILWVAGILTANHELAGTGWKTMLVTAILHLTIVQINRWILPTGRKSYLVRGLLSTLVILLVVALGSVFYFGLVYLHILRGPAGFLQSFTLWIQSLFQNSSG